MYFIVAPVDGGEEAWEQLREVGGVEQEEGRERKL